MSTVYEITEYSKSTSGSHDVTLISGNNIRRKSFISNELMTNRSTKRHKGRCYEQWAFSNPQWKSPFPSPSKISLPMRSDDPILMSSSHWR